MFDIFTPYRDSAAQFPQKLISLGDGKWCEPRDIMGVEAADADKVYKEIPPRVLVRRRGGMITSIHKATLEEAMVHAEQIVRERDELLFGSEIVTPNPGLSE